jgi:hypothetical protein
MSVLRWREAIARPISRGEYCFRCLRVYALRDSELPLASRLGQQALPDQRRKSPVTTNSKFRTESTTTTRHLVEITIERKEFGEVKELIPITSDVGKSTSITSFVTVVSARLH